MIFCHFLYMQVIVGNEVDAVYKALIEKGVPSEDTVGESTNKDASVLSTVVEIEQVIDLLEKSSLHLLQLKMA